MFRNRKLIKRMMLIFSIIIIISMVILTFGAAFTGQNPQSSPQQPLSEQAH